MGNFAFIFKILTVCFISMYAESFQNSEQSADTKGQEIISTSGKHFVFNFPAPSFTQNAILMISTISNETVKVDISIPGIGLNIRTNTTRTKHAEVYLEMPFSHQQLISAVQNKTVIVQSSHDITVIGMSDDFKIGSFLAIPSRALGTQYYVSSFHESSANFYSGFSISSVSDGTNIRIIPDSGDSIFVQIDSNQTIQIHDGYNDLSGWYIEANKPIAVMSGTVEIGKPWGHPRGFAMLEQMLPIDNYGLTFHLAPFLPLYDYGTPWVSGNVGYKYRIISPQNASITIRKAGAYRAVEVMAGEVYKGEEAGDAITSITSDKPIFVTQYMNPYRETNDLYDDSAMLIVPADEMFASNVTFPVYCIFLPNQKSYINIIIECSQVSGLFFDDSVHVSDWEHLSLIDMCAYRSEISCGTHNVGHIDPNVTFSVTVYWFGDKYAFTNTVGHKLKARVNVPTVQPDTRTLQPSSTTPDISSRPTSRSSSSTISSSSVPVTDNLPTRTQTSSHNLTSLLTTARLTTTDSSSSTSEHSVGKCKSSHSGPKDGHNNSTTILKVLVAVLGLVIMILILVIIILVKRKNNCNNNFYSISKSIKLDGNRQSDHQELMPKENGAVVS